MEAVINNTLYLRILQVIIIKILSLQERKLPVLSKTPAPHRCLPGALCAAVARVVDARLSEVESLAMWLCDTACLLGVAAMVLYPQILKTAHDSTCVGQTPS